MKKKNNKQKIYYVYLIYDVSNDKNNKVFKICKQYLNHIQLSVFSGEIIPSKLLELKSKLEQIIDKTTDSILILEFRNKNGVIQEKLGKNIDYEKFI